jgi:DNA-binding phage protein
MESDIMLPSSLPSSLTSEQLTVQMTLTDHLKRLDVAEFSKPLGERRPIPTIAELAEAAGMSRQGMYKLASNRVASVRFEVLASIMMELRQRGFPTDVSDLITAYPIELTASD